MEAVALGVLASMMLAAFLLGLHVATTLGLLSLALMQFFSDRPLWDLLGLITWNVNTSFILAAVPLFILMGELLLRSGLSERLYNVLSMWLGPLPGGLLHSNIATCAIFAAVSGSSVATAATIGSVALPAFKTRGYDERLVLGSLAAGGTLGILIPPSINFIVYGVLMEVSIGKLYMAGIVPGLLLSALFMAVILVAAVLRPAMAPREAAMAWSARLWALIDMLPAVVLMFLVLGTIYLGVATPTEAAAFGASGAFVLALLTGRMNFAMLKTVCLSSARSTAMVMLLVMTAFILNSVLGVLGVPHAMSQMVSSWHLSQTGAMLVLIAFYLVLGTFMDGFAMMLTTIPVILPMLKALDVDLVWFGVIAVLLTEAALISPPEGLNLYVIHGLRGSRQATSTIMDVYWGVMPFFAVMLLAIALLLVFPEIALWLPTTMKGR